MTSITLHNTKSKTKEILEPIKKGKVSMYVCGPTVYDRAHIGNARPVIVFDTLFRLLRHEYGENNVTYVRNFTDVDDKINATALARQEAGAKGTLEELIVSRTNETIEWYHADMDSVGALRPSHEPRATQYIEEMQDMISELIDKGYAYAVASTVGHNSQAEYVYLDNGSLPSHAFLSVDALQKSDEYDFGELSGRSVDEMIAGSRSEMGEGKRNPMDSVLWKPSTVDQPGWESPWGFGRPGWHIECSAMARKLLGKSFDIHGGGLDLMFPHHENEMAQCKACDGADASAKIWMHNEMLQVEGKKMSKSLGNFFTVRDLLDQGVPGEVIRFVFLSTHYRKPMDWTADKAAQAKATLTAWRALIEGVDPIGVDEEIVALVGDDLNTAGALTRLHAMAKEISSNPQKDCSVQKGIFLGSAQILGLLSDELGGWDSFDIDLSAYADRLDTLRRAAMESKDFAPVDAMKSALIAAGVEVRMSKEGVELVAGAEFDTAKLEGL